MTIEPRTIRRLALLIAVVAAVSSQRSSYAQPSPDDTWGPAPGSGSGSAGSGSGAGSGSAAGNGSGAGSGSGSGNGPRIIPMPIDINAPEVTAAAAPTEVKLGNKLTVYVRATFLPGVVVNVQEPIVLGPAFEVTRKVSQDEHLADGRTTREWQLEVVAWELGDLVIPPIAVTYTASGKAEQVATNAMKVRVVGVLGDVVDDPKAVRGNADPTELLVRDWFWLYLAIGGTVGLITLGLLWRWLARRRHTVVLAGGVVASAYKFDSPASRALARLAEIERSGVLDDDDQRKLGYAKMAEVIREYLAARYRVATFDLTTFELMKQLVKVSAPEESAGWERWLEACDIVKYGGARRDRDQALRTLEEARELVQVTSQTTPAVGAPPAAGEPTVDKPADPPADPPPPAISEPSVAATQPEASP